MAANETAVTDADTERQIQDAAQVLLDLCHAASPPPGDAVPDPHGFWVAQTMSLAVQALFMVEHLEIGKSIADRGQAPITAHDLARRAFGLGVGVGHCLGAVLDPIGQIVTLTALTTGIDAGLASRADLGRRMKP